MNADLAALLYLVASVCFILALRGLSHPTTSRAGNIYGMVGMAIAILTTLATPGVVNYTLIVVGILIGGAIGTVIALRIQMRSEEHTSELQSLMRISYAVFCLKKKKAQSKRT